jgi:uncharacterized protein YneF (UPF0154 family)
MNAELKPSKKATAKSKKIKWCALPASLLLFCIYIGIFHSHRYFGFDSNFWLFATGVICIYSLQSLLLKDYGRWHKLITFLGFVLIGLPLSIFVIMMHNKYVERQLAQHPIATSGIVTELFARTGKRSRTNYAVFSYQADQKTWKQIVRNDAPQLLIGDTVKIICAENDPEIFERIVD